MYNKYDPKKDKLNINYEQYQKMKELEENKNFQNTNDFKFMFSYIPEEVTKSVLGIRLSLIVKIVSAVANPYNKGCLMGECTPSLCQRNATHGALCRPRDRRLGQTHR